MIRKELLPALRVTVIVVVAQVSQFAVGAKETDVTTVPLTEMVVGRAAVVPLAQRISTVADPAVVASTVTSLNEPDTLSLLTYPAPEKPG